MILKRLKEIEELYKCNRINKIDFCFDVARYLSNKTDDEYEKANSEVDKVCKRLNIDKDHLELIFKLSKEFKS